MAFQQHPLRGVVKSYCKNLFGFSEFKLVSLQHRFRRWNRVKTISTMLKFTNTKQMTQEEYKVFLEQKSQDLHRRMESDPRVMDVFKRLYTK